VTASEAPDELVQMNVRVPASLRAEIDERRAEMRRRTGRKISRDQWVANAAKFALQQHPQSPPGRQRR
jgi:hypothetical protein